MIGNGPPSYSRLHAGAARLASSGIGTRPQYPLFPRRNGPYTCLSDSGSIVEKRLIRSCPYERES